MIAPAGGVKRGEAAVLIPHEAVKYDSRVDEPSRNRTCQIETND
jgi:hypothetical protein